MSDDAKRPVSRRDSFRLASGMVALGAGLGIAVRSDAVEAAGAPVRLQIKFMKASADQKPMVLHTVTLPDDVAQALSEDGGTAIQIKWFRQAEGAEPELLGVHPFPASLQIKYSLKMAIKNEASIKMTTIKQSQR
jgi:hypothetical protein